jgi:hydroxymethylbilane synthase
LELVTMKTTGDLILDRTLEQIGGKGLFVKELDRALRQGEVDLTVHSLKDMPMETPEDLPIVAYTCREDPRDVLVLPEGVSVLNPEKPIGCSSRRRQLQLATLYPEMEVQPVRGNLQTRLAKLDGGQFSALVLAAAGLKRLGLEHRISRYFTPEEILPAAGQGIIAVQGRAGEEVAPLSAVRSADAGFCAQAERAFVRTLNGGCTSPVAAYAQCRDGVLTLTGLYVSSDESVVRRGTLTGLPEEGEALGRALAQKLKEGDL